jgi:single-strand DNA-binding protein
MRYTPSGQPVTSFSLASSRKYKTGTGEQVKETTWVRCSAWGKAAEILDQYIHKGDRLYVSGRLVPDKESGGPRIWTGQDGSPRASFEMTVLEFEFLTSKGESNGPTDEDAAEAGVKVSAESPLPDTETPAAAAEVTDDSPF